MITITITGERGAGKTTTAIAIARMLKDLGQEVLVSAENYEAALRIQQFPNEPLDKLLHARKRFWINDCEIKHEPGVESATQREAREKAFTYHAPHSDQSERYQKLRTHAGSLSFQLNLNCPPSRELSLAQTKLEEAVMWANAAIARNEKDPAAPSDG